MEKRRAAAKRGYPHFWRMVEASYADVCDALIDPIRQRLRTAGASALTPAVINQRQAALLHALRAGAHGDLSAVDDLLKNWVSEGLLRALDFTAFCQLVTLAEGELTKVVVAACAAEAESLSEALAGMHTLTGRVTAVVGQALLRDSDRRAGEERERGQQAADLGRQRVARLFDSGILSVLVCDLAGNIREANDAFLEMVGYTREELLSGQVRWSEMTPPEWRHLDDAAIEQLQSRGVTRPWEKEYIRKDSSRVPILVGVAMLNDTECIAFALDISERKRLEEMRTRSVALEHQNRRIQEANRLKSEFLANMSHELRTPLNSIIGFADILQAGEVDPSSPQHGEFLRDILTSGRHLLQLINDVLDLAKVEAGKIEFRPEAVDLDRVANEVGSVLRTVAVSKRIQLDVEVGPAVRHVTADPSRLKQVLYNYASNAIKFTEEGGHVVIRATATGDKAFRVEVQDDGIGVSAADQARLFVEFQQLDSGMAKRHQGTGLGLALTKRIVEAQGGSVGVDSMVGRGSTFWAVLPLQPEATAALEIEPKPTEAAAGSAVVLVVEDDARDRRLLAHSLGRAGYAIEMAATGAEAITFCKRRPFDAITLDLLLPDMTGLDVLHSIRAEGLNTETPVFVVSVVAEKGVVAGYAVHDYLRKPIDGAKLLASLRRAHLPPEITQPILVVDDDPAALRLMEVTLGTLGYQAACQSDGEAALRGLDDQPPAAIILDLLMPGIDGFEFLARLRRRPEHRQIPVLVWTMKDLTSADHQQLHRLAQGVVSKNGHPASLVAELGQLLAHPPADVVEG
jgi:PAS domain S-box-containing protein